MVPPLMEARKSGVLNSKGRLNRITENGVVWENGQKEGFDTIVWCTGFRYATAHLKPLGIVDEKFRVATDGTRAKALDGLWLRSAERRVGKECVGTCISRWSRYH